MQGFEVRRPNCLKSVEDIIGSYLSGLPFISSYALIIELFALTDSRCEYERQLPSQELLV